MTNTTNPRHPFQSGGKLSSDEILDIDRRHIWHPYSSASIGESGGQSVFPVASAEGVRITLTSGEVLIDGMSSWWSTIHGYNHPKLNTALIEQTEKMAHVMFGGLTHEPAARLCQKLVALSPAGLNRVFIADSGSVAIEVAMKMALQYWQSKEGDQNSHKRFLTIRSGYHGDTFGAMSVCDPVNGMHQLFSQFLPENIFAPAPECEFGQTWDDRDIEEFTQLAYQHQENIAAVILEPIVQGAGGMRFYSPSYLKRVRELCDELGLLLIADEIATGFGRSGRLFACEHADVSPDILCLGKALTGGYMSLAATLCTDNVAETICQTSPGVFMHGPTFMGNPLACAVANASIELLFENNWQQQVADIEVGLESGLRPCEELPCVKNVRVLGAIGVIELFEPVDMSVVQPMFVEHGIWVRPFGKLVYIMPPFIINKADLAFLTNQIGQVLLAWQG